MKQEGDQHYERPPNPPKIGKWGGAGITAMVLGIVSAVLIPIPILNNMGAIAGLIGAAFAIIGMVGGARMGMSIAGLILCIIGFAGTLAIQASWAHDLEQIEQRMDEEMREIDRQLERDQQRIEEDLREMPTQFCYDGVCVTTDGGP